MVTQLQQPGSTWPPRLKRINAWMQHNGHGSVRKYLMDRNLSGWTLRQIRDELNRILPEHLHVCALSTIAQYLRILKHKTDL